MVLLEQAGTAWACQKSTVVHQLLLHTLLGDFASGNITFSSNHTLDFQTHTHTSKKSLLKAACGIFSKRTGSLPYLKVIS